MTKSQYDMLVNDSKNVKDCINLLKKKGETDSIPKLQRKLQFIESHIADINIAA